ncbi:sodium:proton antiporter [Mariprofundus sp. NF]|uniref:cation:proton antiporter n=1 Tax=Mariprofundus sp. NF TaxID=2608716 RepID=UPI00159F82C6|nr:sodium:proton antiporter [Mariprofundus sp. NF]
MDGAHLFDPATAVLLGCLFLLMLAFLRHYTQKTPLPYEAWIILVGIVYAQIQPHLALLPPVGFQPEVIMLMILPLLIFAEGRSVHIQSLLQVAYPVAYLAVAGVLFVAATIGFSIAWLMGIEPIHGLLLGAALAATDPSAAGVVLRRFSIPEKLLMTIEGESLFNDGVAIVLFTTIAGLVLFEQQVTFTSVALDTLWIVLAAAPIGWLLGWVTAKVVVIWSVRNEFTGLTLTIVLAYGTFLLAEHLLHISGIIAVLFAALAFVRGRYTKCEEMKRDGNDAFQSFWAYIATLAGSTVFFMLGVAIGEHTFVLSWAIPGIVLIVLLSRVALIYASPWFVSSCRRWPMAWRHVLTLGGLRGAIPAALVLTIPAEYAYREDFLCLVFVVVTTTLFIQPLLLKTYLKRAPIESD